MRRRSILVLVLSLLPTLVPAAPALAAAPVTLRVMTFNIFYGGDEWNLDTRQWCRRPSGCPKTLTEVVRTIRAADPDVIGFQEGTANECVIADRLGWYCEPRLQLISRFPLIDPPGADGAYAFVELAPGRVAAVGNVHLPSDPYGPYLVRDGAPRAEVLELERSLRLPAIQRELGALPPLADAGIPVFLTGDFNSPSHLDWTPAVDAAREVVRYPVTWPVSKALADAGFRDSYREIHPNPVATPGFTWVSPDTLESVPDEVFDRIDWILVQGPAITTDTEIVGEVGGPDVGIERDPYPTDHRGVVSTFRVTPADPGPYVAARARRVFAGDELQVTFHGMAARVVLVREGGGPADAVGSQPTGSIDGTLTFDTGSLRPGAHEALLVTSGGAVASRSPFWVYEPGTRPRVMTSRDVYRVGQRIRVSWRAAPGYRFDWLGIFAPGRGPAQNADECNAGSCGNGHYLLYEYTDAAIEGTTTFGPGSNVGYRTWPLKVGNYKIRMLMDDGYRLLAISNRFKIVHR